MDPSPSILPKIILILVLILINAFFAAAEMAMVSVNKSKIKMLAEKGNKKALLLKKVLKSPGNFLSTIQIGITFAGFFASASAATSISETLAQFMYKLNIPYGNEISVILITVLLSYITLVFGELLPKRIALQKPEEIALMAIRPINVISKISTPFVKILSASTNLFIKILGLNKSEDKETVSKDEIKSMISIGQESGVIDKTEKDMLDNIFEFDHKVVKEVMTPRGEVFSIKSTTPNETIAKKLISEQFSRVPVYNETRDNIVGILYLKDFFEAVVKVGVDNIKLDQLIRPAYFVLENKAIDDLFKELQDSKQHMAVIIDEYGGFSGIVTIEDLIEEVMGDILDEYDDSENYIDKIDNNTYVVDGLLTLDKLNDYLNLNLESQNIETIGGFVVNLIGNIPQSENQMVEYDNLSFQVCKTNKKRIEKLKIYLNNSTSFNSDVILNN
ncbi:hemolysin family protein [Clostridium perfringens]|uniref:hemolysin family protein n=1 Tax=Clostridium perfringens TaxID=1502 RepID=UPI0018E45623|nr:hemolysin family protein [Clostridium perfringens]ELC8364593.1 HlyC/CorC family transporter [Clostridium perfringens]MBI6036296.1 HlyC/CorC family transporter [Clostridium perfringens]MDH5093500.1 Magnesium and cobalt efflux protein CorC [Clostridium perfringens]MDK0597981.1 hemolysin family protein [Clostridium perfringens]MDK0742716.1 hemolysin family protein [Clostridium perfringens]